MLCLKLISPCRMYFPNIYIHLHIQGLRTVELSQPVSKISHAKAVILNITGAELQTTTPKICREQFSQSHFTQPTWSKPAPKGNHFQVNNSKRDGPNQWLANCHQLTSGINYSILSKLISSYVLRLRVFMHAFMKLHI